MKCIEYPSQQQWSMIDECYQWLAQDEDGSWWAYEVEPNQYDKGWYENEVANHQFLVKLGINLNWRKTLTKRVDLALI